MRYRRMPIEVESPEEVGYDSITCNLAESSIADANLDDLGVDLRGPHAPLRRPPGAGGPPRARRGRRWASAPADGVPLGPDDVLATVGAAGALFIVATALLEPGDEIVVVRPNYATNLETPRAIGADVRILDLEPEQGWATDPDALAALLTPPDPPRLDHQPAQPDGRSSTRPSCAASSGSSRRTRRRASWWTRPIAR